MWQGSFIKLLWLNSPYSKCFEEHIWQLMYSWPPQDTVKEKLLEDGWIDGWRMASPRGGLAGCPIVCVWGEWGREGERERTFVSPYKTYKRTKNFVQNLKIQNVIWQRKTPSIHPPRTLCCIFLIDVTVMTLTGPNEIWWSSFCLIRSKWCNVKF